MPRAATKAPAKAGARRSGSYVHAAQRGTVQVLLRIPRELHAEYAAVAESEDGMTLQDWIREACEWHRRRAKHVSPSPDDLDAGNPLEDRR